jgi:type VI secretion system protein ImpE
MTSPLPARETLQSGNVRQALDLLKAEVRRAPRDVRLLTFLFQMFCITGEWDRALTQLHVAGELDPLAYPMVQTYQATVRCEVLRAKVFAGDRTPNVLGDPGPWLPLLIQATRLLATGQPEQAASLRDAAFDAAPSVPATIDGAAAEWIADADPRLGPTIEAIIDGKYLWIPYDRIRAIALDPPQDLRDQVWMPATFTWTNKGSAVGFIPTRYPGTTDSADPALLLARRTEFHDTEHWSIPIGQRMIVTDSAEIALMDLRHLDLASVLAPA